QAHVKLGLAAAGDAVDERRMEGAAVEQTRQRHQRSRLLLGQRPRLVAIDKRRDTAGKRISLAHFLAQVNEATAREAAQRAKVNTMVAKRGGRLRLACGCQRREGGLLACAQRRIRRYALSGGEARTRRRQRRGEGGSKGPG